MKTLQQIEMWVMFCLLMACGHSKDSTPTAMTAPMSLETGEAELAIGTPATLPVSGWRNRSRGATARRH